MQSEENGIGEETKLEETWNHEKPGDVEDDAETKMEAAAKHRCEICSKGFSIPARLTRHYRTHSGEKPWSCNVCGKSFAVKENLSVHLRVHTKERPYRCETCGRAFEHSGKLHRHRRIHTGERPHQCPVCGKDFIQSGQLVIHQRSHTGEKPFICRTCDKGFTCSKQLKVHQRTHTGEKPYTCKICNKSFGYNHVLKFHLMSHYGSKYYRCKNCSAESFSTLQKLKQHLKHCSPNNDLPTTSRDSLTATESEEEKMSVTSKRSPKNGFPVDQASYLSDSLLQSSVNLNGLPKEPVVNLYTTVGANQVVGRVQSSSEASTELKKSFETLYHTLSPTVPDFSEACRSLKASVLKESKSEGSSPEPLLHESQSPSNASSSSVGLLKTVRRQTMPSTGSSSGFRHFAPELIDWGPSSTNSVYRYEQMAYSIMDCNSVSPRSQAQGSAPFEYDNSGLDFHRSSTSSPILCKSASTGFQGVSSYLTEYQSTNTLLSQGSSSKTEDLKRVPFRKRSFAFLDSSTDSIVSGPCEVAKESPSIDQPRSQSVIMFARKSNDSFDS